MYLWGDEDATVGRIAAEATADFVTGPYRFEVLPGVGHFITDQAPERATELLLQHVGAYSAHQATLTGGWFSLLASITSSGVERMRSYAPGG